jgi:hypothetical protein
MGDGSGKNFEPVLNVPIRRNIPMISITVTTITSNLTRKGESLAGFMVLAASITLANDSTAE